MAKKVSRKPAPRRKTAAPKRGGKHVFFFGDGKADGNRSMRDTLGGKGAGLAEMTNAGLPVPAGFTISTDVCNLYYSGKGSMPPLGAALLGVPAAQIDSTSIAVSTIGADGNLWVPVH